MTSLQRHRESGKKRRDTQIKEGVTLTPTTCSHRSGARREVNNIGECLRWAIYSFRVFACVHFARKMLLASWFSFFSVFRSKRRNHPRNALWWRWLVVAQNCSSRPQWRSNRSTSTAQPHRFREHLRVWASFRGRRRTSPWTFHFSHRGRTIACHCILENSPLTFHFFLRQANNCAPLHFRQIL